MTIKRRRLIQIIITVLLIANCAIYYLYINDFIPWKALSIGDLNPYGGWSALKSYFTDLSYRWTGITRSMALTISIIVTALFLGRFFCGFICPVGSLQDFFRSLGRKLGIKERRPLRGRRFRGETIKYFILLILLILSILGLGNLISPYSPWLAYLNVFLGLNINIGFIILLAIILLSLFVSRVFCRFFCPLGAFQALLYAIGPLKVKANKDCGSCTYCIKDCPVDMEKVNGDEISPECINCLECIETKCIKGREAYSLTFGKTKLEIKRYIAISLLIFFSIYVFLPQINPKSKPHSIENIGKLNEGTYLGRGIGFGGTMEIEVKIENGRIAEISPISHSETKGYFEEVFKSISREILETQSFNVDRVSGATATSRGFINAIKSGISQGLEK